MVCFLRNMSTSFIKFVHKILPEVTLLLVASNLLWGSLYWSTLVSLLGSFWITFLYFLYTQINYTNPELRKKAYLPIVGIFAGFLVTLLIVTSSVDVYSLGWYSLIVIIFLISEKIIAQSKDFWQKSPEDFQLLAGFYINKFLIQFIYIALISSLLTKIPNPLLFVPLFILVIFYEFACFFLELKFSDLTVVLDMYNKFIKKPFFILAILLPLLLQSLYYFSPNSF